MTYDEVLDAPRFLRDGVQVLPIEFIDPSVPTVDEATRQARMVECLKCEHLEPVNCCSQCGCWVSAKTWVAAAGCPVGKWGAAPAQSAPEA